MNPARYGCFNRASFQAFNVITMLVWDSALGCLTTVEVARIPNRFDPRCQHYKTPQGPTDSRCQGCFRNVPPEQAPI